MKDYKSKTHDSYGAISLSRCTSTGTDLFCSQIKNTSYIALRINEAEEAEHYGTTKHFIQKRIVEVHLSPNQFSELITTMNVSEGVPCTIRYTKEKGVIDFPGRPNQRELTESYLKEIIGDLSDRIKKMVDDVEKLEEKKTVSKKDKDELKNNLMVLNNHLRSNIPFVEKTFREVMDDAVTEAKADVDAFVTGTIQRLGIESLNEKRNLLED